ncbi:MAG: sulfotransferase domain-containing protein [Mycobacterium sp.]|nr:sulfotransferase domain-containing protein [Mycobacterium sp.]
MRGTIAGDQVVVIIGAAKCGTTSLFKYLSQHPAVCPSVPKEPAYFSDSRDGRLQVDRYEDVWPDFDPSIHQYALEGSVVYTMWPEGIGAPARMRAYGVRPRLIYMVRDPIERIESQVNFRRIYSRQRISFRDSHPVDASRYAAQLDPYVETFGRECVRVVEFAQLRTDPGKVCAEIFDWLGLEPSSIADLSASNETANLVRSHLDRAVADSEAMRRAARLLPPTVRRLGKKAALKLAPYHHKEIRLSPERTQEIRELLHQDVTRFAHEWGVDVSEWGFDEATEADADRSGPLHGNS